MTNLSLLTLALIALAIVLLLWLVWAWMRSQRQGRHTPYDAYTQALSALISGDRRAALTKLKDAVQGDSSNIDAYIRLGDLLRESGEPKKALAVHRDLTVRSNISTGDRIRILESLTRDLLSGGRFEEAGQSAERLRSLDRQSRFAHRALQEVAEALEDWPRAVKVVGERAKLEGQTDKALLARYHGFVGGQELVAGNTKEARSYFEQALKLDPECLLATYYLGEMDAANGDTEKAVEHWRQFALNAPGRGNLVFERLERAYFELGRFGDVVNFYRELLHRSPAEVSVPALLALAEIHRRKGDLDEAENFIQEALEIESDHPRAYRHLVKLALDRNDPQEALTQIDRLLSNLRELEGPGNCRHCQARLTEPVWRCPECKALNPLGL